MERRKYTRVPFAKEIIFNDQHNEHMARTINISRAGVFIETDSTLPIGAMVDLTINDDDFGRILTLSGHVCRVKDGRGMAIQYIQPTKLLDNIIHA